MVKIPEVIIEELALSAEPFTIFKALNKFPYSFFLDSSSGTEKLGRFSFLGCDPFLVFRSKNDSITLEWADGKKEAFKSDPFNALKETLNRYNISSVFKDIPFTSGAVGYFGYDLKDFVEKLPDSARDDMALPDCILGFYDVVFIYDNVMRKSYIASSGLPETEFSLNKKRKSSRLKEFKDRISVNINNDEKALNIRPSKLVSNFSKTSYGKCIRKAKEYIKKGDIYQVNLSQRFQAPLNIKPLDLYSRLRDYSPAPFSSYLDFKDVTILSSSPERFLMKRGNYIETRPIKGTRPRGEDSSSDSLLEKELSESRKDRAEHIMIVDLERNDLGRICEYGSVRPIETSVMERYPNVFHLVSTVSGRLKKGVSPVDCLLATFPGGSITGAPKIRSMEIIEELEPVKRSIYTGVIGYISFDGNMDTSIVIRTFVIKDKTIYFQVGGGIVADSTPDEEYEETIHKARGLMKALGKEFVTV